MDGTLHTHGVFDEQGLVMMPEGLSFVEAATLSCAGLTAWNALFGMVGKSFSAGQWLLTCKPVRATICERDGRQGDCHNQLERESRATEEAGC